MAAAPSSASAARNTKFTASTRSTSRASPPGIFPYSLRILLENLLRTEDGRNVTEDEIRALAAWNSKSKPDKEIAFTPSRVLLQDFTGVPAVVDLAAMRDAMKRLSRRSRSLINPLQPAELVIDHSVQVDEFGTPSAFDSMRNWNSSATKSAMLFCAGARPRFRNLAIVPPDTGIVHQVNLEYLARVVFVQERMASAPLIPTRWSVPIRTPP